MTARRAAALILLLALLIASVALYRLVTGTTKTTSAGATILAPDRDAYLYVVKASGGSPSLIAPHTPLPFDAEDPAWSPDGTSVAFTGIGCGGCEPAVYVLDLRDMRARRLTAGSRPAWSRRGWIAFVRRGADGVDRIYVMRPDGRNIHALFPGGANGSQPSWSPDGRKIAFVRLVGDPQHGNPQIFVAHADGTGAVDLANDPSAAENSPAWSPDGKRMAFSNAGPRGLWELYLMRADGEGKRRLAAWAGNVSSPSWSPDGKQIVVMSDAARKQGFPWLYVIRADGHGFMRLTHASTEDFGPAWSPDGTRIAFSRRGLVRIVDR
ncbi:MAG: PD40 domain-containing protein [Chloroflexi bacterium]|nr:PD40 domain-containing protein [Chloroflexota bacterium]